jgi:CubicO group peptidase (beta-lactamase class C family)
MKRTSMVWEDVFESDYALGYDESGKPVGHRMWNKPGAAGSMDTTIRDYSLFLRGVMRGEGISRSAKKLMLSPQVRIRSKHQFPTPSDETTDENDGIRLSYGLGWGLLWSPYGKAYFKEGHDDGWNNYSICFEKPKTAIIIMSNSSNGESTFRELLDKLIGDRFTPWKWENYLSYSVK